GADAVVDGWMVEHGGTAAGFWATIWGRTHVVAASAALAPSEEATSFPDVDRNGTAPRGRRPALNANPSLVRRRSRRLGRGWAIGAAGSAERLVRRNMGRTSSKSWRSVTRTGRAWGRW